jgi:TetR/AcrR family transcriptional repressor of nem operon
VEKAKSRERILDAAARRIREGGFDSLSIAELMKSANLTHGGFYGHFPSRDALVAEALGHAMDRSEAAFASAPTRASGYVTSIVDGYLSPEHRDNPGGGCAVGALACDVARSSDDEVRALMASRLERAFEQMAEAMGDSAAARDAAVTAWCTMVGAIALSRVFRGRPRSDEILRQARQSIVVLEAHVRESEGGS